jgi:hypothetical protein
LSAENLVHGQAKLGDNLLEADALTANAKVHTGGAPVFPGEFLFLAELNWR